MGHEIPRLVLIILPNQPPTKNSPFANERSHNFTMVLQTGDRVVVNRGSYSGYDGTFLGNRGLMSCGVRLDGTNREVTIRRTSVSPMVDDPPPEQDVPDDRRQNELQVLHRRLSNVLQEMEQIQERLRVLSFE